MDGKALNVCLCICVCVFERSREKGWSMVAIYRISPFVLPLSHCAIHHTVKSMGRVRDVG